MPRIDQSQATASKRRVAIAAVDAGGSLLNSDDLWFWNVLGTKPDGTEFIVMTDDPVRGVTVPTATLNPSSPAATEVGDLVIVVTWTVAGAGVPTHTLQSNFTQILSQSHDDGSTDGRLSVAYFAPAGADAGTNIAGAQAYQAYTSSGGTSYTGLFVIKRGYFTMTGIQSAGTNDTTATAPNPPSVTLNQKKIVLTAAGWHMTSGATVAVTPPSGYTEAFEMAGSQAAELSLAYRLFKTAIGTAEDPGTFADDVTPNGSACVTIAITMTPGTQGDVFETNKTTKRGQFFFQLAASNVDTDPWVVLYPTNAGGPTDAAVNPILVDIIAPAAVNVTQWAGANVAAPNTAGVPRVDVKAMEAGVVTAAAIATSAIDADALAADAVAEIQSGLATAASLATVAGYIDTEIADIQSRLPAALVGGRMDSSVGAMATGVIDLASFAADARLGLFREIRRNTAQGGSVTEIQLDAAASAVDDFYNDDVVLTISGTGALQTRVITDYVGATKTCTVPAWTAPDNTTVFAIFSATKSQVSLGAGAISLSSFSADALLGAFGVVESGTAQTAGATSIRLRAGADASDGRYKNGVILTTGGTGALQLRTITGYTGTTKDADVDEAWATNPDATTTYTIFVGDSAMAAARAVWFNLQLEGSDAAADILTRMRAGSIGKLTGLDAIRAAGGNGTAQYYDAAGNPLFTIVYTTDGRTNGA